MVSLHFNNMRMITLILEKLKIKELNEMQTATIEAVKKGSDIVLLSPTGSGKTLAFLLPVLNKLQKEKSGVQALVLAPSRELAIQIEQVFRQMSTGYKVNCCYGGHAMRIEKNNLLNPPALLIGTPGRIADHIDRNNIDTSSIHTLVLDEFDKALEFGFEKEMDFIISRLNNLNQRILTSATRPEEIPAFTGLSSPAELDYIKDHEATRLKVKGVLSEGEEKLEILLLLLSKVGDKPTLIFCNHREAVDRISHTLQSKGLYHDIFHGGLEQDDRERALIKFRNGSHRILITTDLASRGLDIPEVESVIHYQIPTNESAFIHRNGRTARMHAKGTAYLLLTKDEYVPKYIKEELEYEKLPEKLKLPENSEWTTLYIAAGKKDKISKTDIVGFLMQKGNLQKDDLGKIETLDFSSFAAVKRNKVQEVLRNIKDQKLKNRKLKIEVSK